MLDSEADGEVFFDILVMAVVGPDERSRIPLPILANCDLDSDSW